MLWCQLVKSRILKAVMLASKSENMLKGGDMQSQLTIQDVANWFLTKEAMTHKKLQKITYYAVAWGWALMNKSAAQDSEFQAWVHGPVSPVLYEIYKEHGWNAIPKPDNTTILPKDISEVFESVWLTYGDKSGNELETLSHSEKPWIEARAGLQPHVRSSRAISTATMREFYNSIKSTEY